MSLSSGCAHIGPAVCQLLSPACPEVPDLLPLLGSRQRTLVATPGLLTLDRSGLGPGAVLNQDYSTNGAANPAPRGQALMIYCVGGGVTNPPSTDGAIITAPAPPALPPVLTQPVSDRKSGV